MGMTYETITDIIQAKKAGTYRLRFIAVDPTNPAWRTGVCEREGCNKTVGTYSARDTQCRGCGAIYNGFGQRLRDDLYSRPNPSEWDDDCDDMTGYELAMGFDN
jgi:hypothetical protein